MRFAPLAALCALLSANPLLAASSLDSLDVYLLSGEIEVPAGGAAPEEDADGFGAKFRGSVGDDFFFSGEYQRLSVQGDVADHYTEWRLGLGTPFAPVAGVTPYGLIEYVHAELADTRFEDDGAALHLGLIFSPVSRLSVYGQGGYVKLREADGPEYLLGLAFQVRQWGGVFAEYRDTDLELDGAGAPDGGFSGVRTGIYLVVP